MSDVTLWQGDAPKDLETLSSAERRALLKKVTDVSAIETESDKLKYMGKTLHLTNVLGHRVRLTDEATGEITEQVRTVFLCKEVSLSFTSKAATEFAELCFAVLGKGPWAEPLPIRFTMVKTRKGYTTYAFMVAE
jgi:hypothetical protein